MALPWLESLPLRAEDSGKRAAPKAPARPPPLPRWMRTSRTRKMPDSSRMRFKIAGNHPAAKRTMFALPTGLSFVKSGRLCRERPWGELDPSWLPIPIIKPSL